MKEGIVVLGHGSRAGGEANRAVFEISARLREKAGHDLVETALLNRGSGQPTVAEAVAGLVARGAGRIVVAPLFLTAGVHIRLDIPAEIAALRRRFPGVAIALAAPVGPDPRLADILLERVQEVK